MRTFQIEIVLIYLIENTWKKICEHLEKENWKVEIVENWKVEIVFWNSENLLAA